MSATSSTPTTKGTRGGWRPGGGAKPKVQDARKVLFFIDPAEHSSMSYLADTASYLVRKENAKVPTRDRDHLITRSELVRIAIEAYVARLHDEDTLAWVQRLRPYLGGPKPPENGDNEKDAPLSRLDTYVGAQTKDTIDAFVDNANEIVAQSNQGLEKEDWDPRITNSDVYREAIYDFLERNRDPVQLAHALRPKLGQSKRS